MKKNKQHEEVYKQSLEIATESTEKALQDNTFDKIVKATDKLSEATQTGGEVIGKALKEVFTDEAKCEKSERTICKVSRNNCGLIDGLNYEFDELGFVNYKKLIPREFLVPNRQHFQSKKIAIPESIDGLADREMIVLLNGYKTLAAIRGFKSVDHKIVSSSFESVTIETTIKWIGNYETDFREVSYTALATASLNNTYSFCKNYLAEIAQNRGECRAIRGFLRIPILASDELGPQNEQDDKDAADAQTLAPAGPHYTLSKKLDEKNTSFEKVREGCIKKGFAGAESWTSLRDIPVDDVRKILEGIKEKESKITTS